MVKRLRAERGDAGFTISLRVSCNAQNVDGMRDVLATYRDVGVQHVMTAPEDRDIDTLSEDCGAILPRRGGPVMQTPKT